MTQVKAKIARNTGIVEFLANLERIKTMSDAGYNLRNIHKILTEESKFTMSLLTFRYHYRKYKKGDKKQSKIANISTPVQAMPVQKPVMPSAVPSKGKATKPEDIDINSVF